MKRFIRIVVLVVLIIGCVILATIPTAAKTSNEDEPVVAAAAAKIMNISIENILNESKYIPYSETINVRMSVEDIQEVNLELQQLNTEIEMLSKVIYREARGLDATHRAAVVWCILNRVDHEGYGDTIQSTLTSPNQFAYYPDTPVLDSHTEIAKDVVTRWLIEHKGYSDVGRVLPQDYLFFTGDGQFNYFRQNFNSTTFWNWNMDSPYLVE